MKRHLIITFVFFMLLVFSRSASAQFPECWDWEVNGYGYSDLLYDNQAMLVSGIAGTTFVVSDYTPSYCDNDFDAWVYSELANSSGVLSYGRLQSESWSVEGQHPIFNAQPRTYCVTSSHGFAYYLSVLLPPYPSYTEEYTTTYSQDCYTFQPPPTPTPTPTPTPCPPGLDKCPDPAATISQIDLVEKFGLADVNVSVSNAEGATTTFSLRTTAGTGSATFDDGTTSKSFTGNVNNQVLRIRGVTECSQIDNIIIEAKYGSRLLANDNFTVAVISSLDFQRINTDDLALDGNPGTDGVVNPDGSEGQRIIPDRNSPTDLTDRSVIRVRAEISPAMPNAKVYFSSFDLDDPSAIGLPIDTTANDGNDNNGAVNNSRSGELMNPTGGTCVLATIANNISRIECTAGASKGATANYRITMQPGDNFAVAASLVETYRSQIRIDLAAGGNLINNANQIIPISGEANPNSVQGIRTRMLTTWRRLHIEVDSMSSATENRAIGTIASTTRIRVGQTAVVPLNPTTPSSLAINQFEGGRLVYNSTPLPVTCNISMGDTCNTINSVTVQNRGGSLITLFANTTFQLYDDDDMDDEDVGNLNGDEGDDVPEPSDVLIRYVDTPCSATVTTGCNIFAAAYVKPIYDLVGSNENTGFNANINTSVDPATTDVPPGEVQAWFNFNNVATAANSNFWTIYEKGVYQYDVRRDNDPSTEGAVLGTVDELNGQGLLVFSEVTRPLEIPNFAGRPVGRQYTLAHEIGHLFYGLHQDGDLMTQTASRTIGTFSDVTINKIRGGEFTDILGVTRRIRNP